MEALDPASFRAGEPTSRQGLRVEVGARRGDRRDGEIRDAHLVAAREAPRDCTAVIRAVERSLFSSRDQRAAMLYAVVLKHWFVCLVVKPSARRATTGTVIGFLFN